MSKEKERAAPAPKSNVFSSLDEEEEDDEGSSSGSATPTPRGSSKSQGNGHGKLSAAQLEARTDAILGEYLSTFEVVEAVESIRELQAPDSNPQIVVRAINMVLEQNKPNQLDHLDALFAQGFSAEELSQGLVEMLSNVAELDIDIPMASRHVAVLIGSAIARGAIAFEFLFSGSLASLVESGKAEVILGAALQKINKELVLFSHISLFLPLFLPPLLFPLLPSSCCSPLMHYCRVHPNSWRCIMVHDETYLYVLLHFFFLLFFSFLLFSSLFFILLCNLFPSSFIFISFFLFVTKLEIRSCSRREGRETLWSRS